MANSREALLNLEQIKANFPPQKTPFPIRVKDGEGTIEAIVSMNNEGVIIYVEPGSAKFLQSASEPENSGV